MRADAHRWLAWALACALPCACGGPPSVPGSIATVRPVRAEVVLDGAPVRLLARAAAGSSLRTGTAGLARVELDGGARLLVDRGAELGLDGADAIDVVAGRLLADVPAGEALHLTAGALSLRTSDGALSVATTGSGAQVYALRGEIRWRAGEAGGLLGAGQELALAAGRSSVRPTVLFDDWTGGLWRAGPEAGPAAGMGSLEARVPDQAGLSRWPLAVQRLDARVRIEGDLAITDVEQVFFNPASETVEGLYRVRVPEDAVLQRFAVDRDGTMVDGYVREEGQARAAYEAQVYRGSTQDPALLEWEGPGRYRARLYPIAPGAVRRVAIRYASWLAPAEEGGPRLFRHPLGSGPDAPRIAELSIAIDLAEAEVSRVRAGLGAAVEGRSVVLRQSDARPPADLWVELWDARPAELRAGTASHAPPPRAPGARVPHESDERDYWFLPLRLPDRLFAEADGLDLVVVADLSAGTDRAHLELGQSAIEALAAHLGPTDRIAVFGADLGLRALGDGELGPASPARLEAALEALSAAPAAGASDLGAALAEAAAVLDAAGRPGVVVYVGDAVPTVGQLDARELLAHLGRLPRRPRIYGLAVGAEARLELLDALAAGGGLALRVEDRTEAADAALQVLAHAGRPLASHVTIDLGSGVEGVFPRGPVDVARGDVLAIAARVRTAPPAEVIVRGERGGERFEERLAVATEALAGREGRADLRLRWAGRRLSRLLEGGASREEIAEVGTRYGLLTPYTSYYVPSASEIVAAQAQAAPGAEPATAEAERLPVDPAPMAAPVAAAPPPAPAPAAPAPPRRTRGSGSTVTETVPQPRSGSASGSVALGSIAASGAVPAATIEALLRARLQVLRACYEGLLRRQPSSAGTLELLLAIAPDGSVRARAAGSLSGEVSRCVERRLQDLRFSTGPGSARLSLTFSPAPGSQKGLGPGKEGAGGKQLVAVTTVVVSPHARRRCSDASEDSLDERRALWRERLASRETAPGWLEVRSDAVRDCEAPGWRDRRALDRLILERAGSLAQMLEVYRLHPDRAAREALRAAILRHVRSPDDLRLVREAFGAGPGVDWALVEQILARAPSPAARIQALRALVRESPGSFPLALRLLGELEAERRIPEALRLGASLRRDPLADADVRTAIGELFVRLGRADEARRAFSEIVEQQPDDALARRRLGDLYRAHGWPQDAYRQYRTLAAIRPDDPEVLLLLAQAAADAGRIDEALRLEERLASTAEPGARQGLARIARLWSAVRFARLRATSRQPDRVASLRARMRRTGVLRGAGALRVILTWSHPDAQLSLFAAHPDGALARPAELAPELGLEAFEVQESEPGTYRIEVRRSARDRLGTIGAELCVVWRQGAEDEHVEIVPLSFDAEHPTRAFTIDGEALGPAAPPR